MRDLIVHSLWPIDLSISRQFLVEYKVLASLAGSTCSLCVNHLHDLTVHSRCRRATSTLPSGSADTLTGHATRSSLQPICFAAIMTCSPENSSSMDCLLPVCCTNGQFLVYMLHCCVWYEMIRYITDRHFQLVPATYGWVEGAKHRQVAVHWAVGIYPVPMLLYRVSDKSGRTERCVWRVWQEAHGKDHLSAVCQCCSQWSVGMIEFSLTVLCIDFTLGFQYMNALQAAAKPWEFWGSIESPPPVTWDF